MLHSKYNVSFDVDERERLGRTTAKSALYVWLLLASGCATTFTGSAQVEGGRAGCEKKCSAIGLQMQAFVFMGEYSSACVCDVPGPAAQADNSGSKAALAMGALTQLLDMADQQCMMQDCGRF